MLSERQQDAAITRVELLMTYGPELPYPYALGRQRLTSRGYARASSAERVRRLVEGMSKEEELEYWHKRTEDMRARQKASQSKNAI